MERITVLSLYLKNALRDYKQKKYKLICDVILQADVAKKKLILLVTTIVLFVVEC